MRGISNGAPGDVVRCVRGVSKKESGGCMLRGASPCARGKAQDQNQDRDCGGCRGAGGRGRARSCGRRDAADGKRAAEERPGRPGGVSRCRTRRKWDRMARREDAGVGQKRSGGRSGRALGGDAPLRAPSRVHPRHAYQHLPEASINGLAGATPPERPVRRTREGSSWGVVRAVGSPLPRVRALEGSTNWVVGDTNGETSLGRGICERGIMGVSKQAWQERAD